MAELFDILVFRSAIVEDIDIITTDPDWTDLVSLVATDMDAGVYSTVASIQFHQNSTSQDFLYQFSMDGGSTWGPVYLKRVKGKDNIEVLEVLNVLELTGVDDIQLSCRVSRSGSADTTVIKAIITIERKN